MVSVTLLDGRLEVIERQDVETPHSGYAGGPDELVDTVLGGSVGGVTELQQHDTGARTCLFAQTYLCLVLVSTAAIMLSSRFLARKYAYRKL